VVYKDRESPRVKLTKSPPSTSQVKNAWSYTSAPSIRRHSVELS